jgi:hypothetical protein
MSNRGRPSKNAEELRDAPVTFRTTKTERDLFTCIAKAAKYKQRGLFMYDLVLSILAQEKFTLLIPGEPAEDLRRHYKNSSTNLNALKRDYYYLAERGINEESERKALKIELAEHSRLTKELHTQTFRKQITLPIGHEFWEQLAIDSETGNINLLTTAKKLMAVRKTKKGTLQEEIAELELRLHELKSKVFTEA